MGHRAVIRIAQVLVSGAAGFIERAFAYRLLNRGKHRMFNVGDSRPIGLMDMIKALENVLGCKTRKIMHLTQPGDVTATSADKSKLHGLYGYHLKEILDDDLQRLAKWHEEFRKIPA